MKRLIHDISQRLSPATPVWPGDTILATEAVWSHGPGSSIAVARLTLSAHTGTHADAPLHYDPAGDAIADVSLDPYLGAAQLIDLSGHKGAIEPDDLVLDEGTARVLIRTFREFPHDSWPDEFACVSPEAVAKLDRAGVVLIGTDTPSLDPARSRTLDAHRAVRRAGMCILEGLVLDHVPAGHYELIALPLKIEGLDASPVRAILRACAS